MNVVRLKKEIEMLARDPGPGISAWPDSESSVFQLTGLIVGPEESPYEGGMFYVSINVPQRYPFEPPSVRFTTPVYHPNIDSEGRICLDTLKMQPQGSWSPSTNINSLLLTIRILLRHPNADDGLVPSITDQYRRDIEQFNRTARAHTDEHAKNTVLPTAVAVETNIKGTESGGSSDTTAVGAATRQVHEFSSSGEYDSDASDVSTSTGGSTELDRSGAVSVRHRASSFDDNEASTKRVKYNDR